MKLAIGILSFLVIIIPINFINYESTEQTSIFTQYIHRTDFVSKIFIDNVSDLDDDIIASADKKNTLVFAENAIFGFIKYVGWILIPIFIFFCVIGTIFIPKTITKNKIIFGIFFIFLALSSIFAYGRGIQEPRYVLVLLPIFTLLSSYGLNYIIKYDIKKIFPGIILVVVISSFIFVELRNQDFEYESDMYNASLFLVDKAEGVNNYDKDKYVKIAELEKSWPKLLPKGENGKMEMSTKKFPIKGFDDPIKYINFNKNKGLTHLLIIKDDRDGFFNELFIDEFKYPFLEKIYDSNIKNEKTEYKIFQINYEKLDLK